jgi:hypothetical protein
MAKTKDLIGKRFGRLVVVGFAGKGSHRSTLWRCRCDCGTETTVFASNLQKGNTKSCGCIRKEVTAKKNKTLGLSGTKIYSTWKHMKERCQNPNSKDYKRYGGRGICVCPEWQHFEVFYEWAIKNGYQEKLSLDRIDNSKGYTPDNCRWVTVDVQANNTRRNHYLSYNGKTQTMKQWADELGIRYLTLANRINNLHWSDEKALSTPVKKGR